MQTKALITDTRLHAVEEGEGVICRESCHMSIRHSRDLIGQSSHLMEVSSKQTETLNLSSYVATIKHVIL